MKIVNYALPMYLGGVVEYRDKIGKILSLEERNGYCFLWALVGEEFQERRIVVYCVPKGEMWREDGVCGDGSRREGRRMVLFR